MSYHYELKKFIKRKNFPQVKNLRIFDLEMLDNVLRSMIAQISDSKALINKDIDNSRAF